AAAPGGRSSEIRTVPLSVSILCTKATVWPSRLRKPPSRTSRISTPPGSNDNVKSTPKKSMPLPTMFKVAVPAGGNVMGDGAKVIVEFVCRCACGCVLGGAAGVPVDGGLTAGGCPAGGGAAGGVAGDGVDGVGAGEPVAGTFGLVRSRGTVSEP